jgi:hypothetical protein
MAEDVSPYRLDVLVVNKWLGLIMNFWCFRHDFSALVETFIITMNNFTEERIF